MPESIRHACGLLLIAVGLIAMPVPVIPGFPLVLAGAAMLGSRHPMVRRCRVWLRRKVRKLKQR